jgi:hypothetical protein
MVRSYVYVPLRAPVALVGAPRSPFIFSDAGQSESESSAMDEGDRRVVGVHHHRGRADPGVYCFWVLVGFETRVVSRKTNRTAESMYSNYADSNRKQRRYARKRGGEWKDDEGSETP